MGWALVLVAAACIGLLRSFSGGSNSGNRNGKFQQVLYSRIWTDMSAFRCHLCLKNPVSNFSYLVSSLSKNSRRLALNILVSHDTFACFTLSRNLFMPVTCLKLCEQLLLINHNYRLFTCDILAFHSRFFQTILQVGEDLMFHKGL